MRMGLKFAVIVIGMALMGQNLCAIGLGFYGSGGAGTAEELDADAKANNEAEIDSNYAEFGLLLDTAVARNKVFNYRLTLGYRRANIEVNDPDSNYSIPSVTQDYDVDVDGVTWGNAFGFGVFRREAFRLWVGPAVDLSYFQGDSEKFSLDLSGYRIGLGPIFGLNFNFGSVVTLAFSAGYRVSFLHVDAEYDAYDKDYDTMEYTGYGNAALIFRIDDNYQTR